MEDSEGAWSLQTPVGYDDEQSLHDIVVKSPELLPLAGKISPELLDRLGQAYRDAARQSGPTPSR